ncbi:unnamed protein product [Miscanthus lutarioriparius]|uniref:Dirigent protein n=1 Tax=Miscanthus lutarioriparius TaxID=422564 RepID=A0A811Q4T9_9POAL|nr:unnamed protein product [Miscanthus lutarioriparius]
MKHGNGMLLQLALLISLSLAGVVVGGSAPTSTHLRFYMHDLVTPYPGAPATAGSYVFASQTELAPLLCVNMVLTAGPHNGSTVAVLGRDLILDKVDVRELPVVGGTGTLRGVTGYGEFRTHTLNATDGNAVLKIDMYLSLSV